MKKLNEVNEVEVIYKRPVLSSMEKIIISDDIVKVFRSLIGKEKIDLKEFFLVALLSRSNHVLGVSLIGSGTDGEVCVNGREILQLALKTNASSIILCHNHPSGNLNASHGDMLITKQIKEVCKLLKISLLDHIILTSESHYSFADDNSL